MSTPVDSAAPCLDIKQTRRQTPRIYIVGPNTAQNQLLSDFLGRVLNAVCSCHADLPFSGLISKSTDGPRIYLRDCLKCDTRAIEKKLLSGCAPIPDALHIVLFNVDAGCRLEALVRACHLRGIFYREDSHELFFKGIRAIIRGDLWLTRKMLSDCILMPRKDLSLHGQTATNGLSRREKQILHLVALGDSNQQIADNLSISLHTVKTHLYNTYRKINVPNRLQAALWAATYLPS